MIGCWQREVWFSAVNFKELWQHKKVLQRFHRLLNLRLLCLWHPFLSAP